METGASTLASRVYGVYLQKQNGSTSLKQERRPDGLSVTRILNWTHTDGTEETVAPQREKSAQKRQTLGAILTCMD